MNEVKVDNETEFENDALDKDISLEPYEIKAIIESLLFIYGEPLTAYELRDTIDENISVRTIKRYINELIAEYETNNRGLTIFQLDDKYQIGTDKKYADYVERLITPHKKKTLTKSAIETLTIIAYKQPITRVEVEDIRGVKSNAVFETLLNHNLIVSAGIAKKIGNPKLYKTTDNFLKVIGIKSLSELPDLEKYKTQQISLLEQIDSV